MADLHLHYDQLTPHEREACDHAARAAMKLIAAYGMPCAGDDRAERMVDGIARLIIESRKE